MRTFDRVLAAGVFLVIAASINCANAAGDPAKQIFTKCVACHAEDGSNRLGPGSLGVVGRTAGSVQGFRFMKTASMFGMTNLSMLSFPPPGGGTGRRDAFRRHSRSAAATSRSNCLSRDAEMTASLAQWVTWIDLCEEKLNERQVASVVGRSAGSARWARPLEQLRSIASTIRTGGKFWELKGAPMIRVPRRATSEFYRQWTRLLLSANSIGR
jgi:hypothetical protein